MRHRLLIAITAALPLVLGGCGFFGGGTDTATQQPSPDAVPTTAVAAAPNGTAPTAAPANAANPAGILPPDLISSTNPTQRVRGIQRNRPDPFALIQTTPTVEISPNATPPQPVPQIPSLPRPQAASNSTPSSSIPSNSGVQPRNGSLAPTPNLVAQPRNGSLAPIPNLVQSPLAALPQLPQPDLARAVKVTGVVQIGTTLHAIVDAPNEPSSRYVQVGQRLSNNQILVKRIEMNRGSEPVVVLEQNGIEVPTAVGSGGAPSQPTASAPQLPATRPS